MRSLVPYAVGGDRHDDDLVVPRGAGEPRHLPPSGRKGGVQTAG
jgi:hypothetical protein